MIQDIIEIAESCGFTRTHTGEVQLWLCNKNDLERLTKLVAAKEREACAKVCIEHGKVWGERMLLGFQATLDDAAEAIRARAEA